MAQSFSFLFVVCMCACLIFMYGGICLCGHVSTCGGLTEAQVGSLLNCSSTLVTEAVSLNQTQSLLILIVLLASWLWRTPFLPAKAGVIGRLLCPPQIYVGSGISTDDLFLQPQYLKTLMEYFWSWI